MIRIPGPGGLKNRLGPAKLQELSENRRFGPGPPVVRPPETGYAQTIFSPAMSTPALETSSAVKPPIAGMPRWLFFSLLTIAVWGAWGVVSKVASNGVDADTNQIFFTIGLLPLIVLVLRSPRLRGGKNRKAGMAWAFFTGILGGTGNIAFFHALVMGGKASIVMPATALFPLVTVILATTLLHERIGTQQKLGLVLALVAIYLLSM